MAIEITPQRRSRATLFATIIGIISAFLILVLVGSFLYFYITNKSLLENIQRSKDSSLDLDQTIRNKENELLVFQRRIDDFEVFLSKHKDLRKMFTIIEEKTIPFMWFNSFSFQAVDNGIISLTGNTNSFFAVEQQIAIFKGHDLIKKVNLGEITINEEEGGIEFALELVFDPEVFAFEAEEEIPEEIIEE